jgi:hypothetical protein
MTIVRSAVVLLALLGAASAAHAQVIHGRLLDNATGAPIVRGQVTLMQGTRTVMRDAITDDDGRFMLRLRGAGAYRLRGQSIGYRESISSEVHLLPADTIHVELRLATEAFVLAPLTVTAATRMPVREQRLAGFHRRARAGFGQFIGPDEIARLTPFHASELLRGLHGVFIRPSPEGTVVTMRGPFAARLDGSGTGSGCTPTLYVDGFIVRDALLDEVVSGSAVRAVEVYRRASQVPPEFSSPLTFNCGAIAIWTSLTMPEFGR